MTQAMKHLMDQYIIEVQKIYGTHLKRVILYGSYARGDAREDSDVDIMILLDLPAVSYSHLTLPSKLEV